MSFDPCHDCGPNYSALFVAAALFWSSPIALATVRRRLGTGDDAADRRLRRVQIGSSLVAFCLSLLLVMSPW